MAAAEARAAWQRVNRCLVQEDAKRAPKLACCNSSSASSNDLGTGDTATAQDGFAFSLMPLSWKLMNSNLSPEAKWWLQLQPNFGYKDYIYEHLSYLEDEFIEEVETTVATSKLSLEKLSVDSVDTDMKKGERCMESPGVVSAVCMKHGSETRVDMKKVSSYSQQSQKRKVDVGNYYHKDEGLSGWELVDHSISKKQETAPSDLETPWTEGKKSEPWWCITDKDELALLVAQRSLQHIENCDLPKPSQTFVKDPFSSPENLDKIGMFPSSLDQKLDEGICNTSNYLKNYSSCVRLDYENLSSGKVGYMLDNAEKLYNHSQDYAKMGNDTKERNQTSENDPTRAQLLEALRHSQTRARKAEMEAQKAFDEKEHIVKLLLRQASHLFAYKQWLLMLQLENLYLQLKMENHQISAVFPILPWMPLKGIPTSKKKSNTRRKGKKQNKCSFCKYAVVFAIGLGMAGAGLLLGWTMGCLLPTF